MYSGEIISYNISKRPILGQVTDMLDKAFAKTPNNTNLIFHSDQVWQYLHELYQHHLKEKGILLNMSRKCNLSGQFCNGKLFWITQIGTSLPEVI